MTYKVFESGETLTANDVMTYFMNQVVVQVDTEAELADLLADHADVRVAYAQDTDKVYAVVAGNWQELAYEGGDFTFDDLTVNGNLTVNGTTTNINSTNLVVEDKNIIIADVATPTDTTADGAGITIKGSTDKTFNWVDSTDAFTASEHINLASGKEYKVNGTTVLSSSQVLGKALPTGDVVGHTDSQTLTNKTLNLASNTVTGTLAQLNSAISDADVASLAGSETLTNKTISGSNNTITNISLTSGVTGTLQIANGGTGQTTANAGLNALLPSQTSNSGKYLTTNGTDTTWGTVTQYSLPSQTGNSGKFLTTNGTAESWGTVDLTTKTDKATLTTTGDIYYASSASTPARLGIGSTGQILTVAGGIPTWATPTASTPTFRGCAVRASNSISASNDTWTFPVMDLEDFDTDNFHSTTVNPTRITIPTGMGGKYLVVGQLFWDQSASGARNTQIYKNGAGVGWVNYAPTPTWGGGGSWPSTPTVRILNLVAGDYLELAGMQQSGGTLGLSTWTFAVQYLGA